MVHLCALVKQVIMMKRAMMMKIVMMIKIVMLMMTEMVMESDLVIKTVLCFHATGLTSLTFTIVLSCNHRSAQLMVGIILSIKSVKMYLSKGMGTARLPC